MKSSFGFDSAEINFVPVSLRVILFRKMVLNKSVFPPGLLRKLNQNKICGVLPSHMCTISKEKQPGYLISRFRFPGASTAGHNSASSYKYKRRCETVLLQTLRSFLSF